MIKPKPQTVAAWTSLVSANRVLLETIEDALKRADLPPLSWYDALLEIERAEPGGIRPFELKERLLLPQYGMSRLLDRMARAGLVDRDAAEDDGRGQVVRLTPKGRTTRQAMWPVYAGVLTRRIEPHFTDAEAAELARLLQRLGGGR